MSATLYVAISSHGYGHIGQTAPVVNELYRRNGALRVVIECAAPRELLAKRFLMPFEHVPVASDFGMVMKDAFEVDMEASHARYVEAHEHIDADVEAARQRLVEYRADVLLANVPYVPLMAARRIGLRAIAMCSLNWAAIYQKLCGGMPGAERVHCDMLSAYRAADVFIVPEPSMEMPDLTTLHPVGPVGTMGNPVGNELFAKFQLAEGTRLVTVSMGGIATELPLDRWPRVRGVTWIMSGVVDSQRDDMVSLSTLGKPFVDILCSSDAIITKPGYGAFLEAACNGVPVLYVPRVDWPEAPYLVRWLHEHGRCVEVSRGDLQTSRLESCLRAVWELPATSRVVPTGITQAADIIERQLAADRPLTEAL